MGGWEKEGKEGEWRIGGYRRWQMRGGEEGKGKRSQMVDSNPHVRNLEKYPGYEPIIYSLSTTAKYQPVQF